MSHLREVKERTFASEVLASETPVLVDFTADWCPPCRKMDPLLEEFARETPAVRVVSFDVAESPEFAGALGITALPTLVLFKRGRELARWMGSAPKREIERFVASALEGSQ